MADMTISCPHCNQPIACDELWAGHELQCPLCHKNFLVPAPAGGSGIATAAEANNPLVPKPPAGNKLSIGGSKQAHSPQATQAQNKNIPIRNLAASAPKKKNPLPGILTAVVALAVVGGAGYYGYTWYRQQHATVEAKPLGADKPADAQAQAPTPAPAPEPPPEEKPALAPPTWTLDLAGANIPRARAGGVLASNTFVAEIARVDLVGSAQVLRLLQGPLLSPDREVLIYLHPKAGEKLAGQSLSVAKDVRNPVVSQVTKLWKTNPRYAPQMKSFSTGFALKLEFGAATNNTIPGKIFLALPDAEQSVVAGYFRATNAVPELAPGQPAPMAAPAPVPTAGGMSDAERAAFQKRYGLGGGR